MTTHVVPPPPSSRAPHRSWLGIRRTPGRLALALFRMPLRAYRNGKGWLLGRTFLLLVHVGRRTGRPHDTVAMVLSEDRDTGEVIILSGWGPDVDWLKNLRAGPAREVCIGRDHFVPEHRFLSDDEAVAVVADFRRRHPGRVWLARTILGWGSLRTDADVRAFVRDHPFVGLRPARL